jgi:hypothetical protein
LFWLIFFAFRSDIAIEADPFIAVLDPFTLHADSVVAGKGEMARERFAGGVFSHQLLLSTLLVSHVSIYYSI